MNNKLFETSTETLNYLEQTHHAMVRNFLKTIKELVSDIAPGMDQNFQQQVFQFLAELFNVLRMEIDHHLMMEEEIVFPLIRNMETAKQSGSLPSARKLPGLYVAHLINEHEMILQVLSQICQISGNYRPALNSPPTLNELYDQMRLLHADLAEHIQYENTFLFPKINEIKAKE